MLLCVECSENSVLGVSLFNILLYADDVLISSMREVKRRLTHAVYGFVWLVCKILI